MIFFYHHLPHWDTRLSFASCCHFFLAPKSNLIEAQSLKPKHGEELSGLPVNDQNHPFISGLWSSDASPGQDLFSRKSLQTQDMCVCSCVKYNRVVTMLIIKSLTSDSFSSTHSCTAVDLTLPLRRHLYWRAILRYTNFLYIKKGLKRETMEAEVQMPFRTCGQMAWGSLSPERENSLAAARQPGTQPYNIQLLAGILSCCKATKSFSDPNRDRDLKNNKNTSKIY